jgi:amidase
VSDYMTALEDMHAFSTTMAAWWAGGFDLLVTPTNGTLPPKLGALNLSPENIPNVIRWTPYTAYFNLTGQPAISLPLHWSAEGLPVGVQIAAAYGREDLLIRIGAQLEKAKPWAGRVPAVHG